MNSILTRGAKKMDRLKIYENASSWDWSENAAEMFLDVLHGSNTDDSRRFIAVEPACFKWE